MQETSRLMQRLWEKSGTNSQCFPQCQSSTYISYYHLIHVCLQSACVFHSKFLFWFMTLHRTGCATSTWGPGDLNLSYSPHISCHNFEWCTWFEVQSLVLILITSHMCRKALSTTWEVGNCKGCFRFCAHAHSHHLMINNSCEPMESNNVQIDFRELTPHATK